MFIAGGHTPSGKTHGVQAESSICAGGVNSRAAMGSLLLAEARNSPRVAFGLVAAS